MSALSTASTARRSSARERAPAQSLAAEMEYRPLQQADQALMRRLAREPLQYDTASDSEEVEMESDVHSDPDSDVESKENTPPTSRWLPNTHDVHSTPCTAQATVVLPRNRTRTELGYLRCFITDTFIDIIVSVVLVCLCIYEFELC